MLPDTHQGDDVEHEWNGRTVAWLLGPLATGLGWAAHVAGGGQSPAALIVLALAALLAMAAAMLGRRRLPTWGVLVAAAMAQQLLHLAFSAFASATGFYLPGHGHGDAPEQDTASVPGQQPAAAHDLHLLLYLHAGAALLSALVAAQWGRLSQWRAPLSRTGRPRTALAQTALARMSLGRQRAADDADA